MCDGTTLFLLLCIFSGKSLYAMKHPAIHPNSLTRLSIYFARHFFEVYGDDGASVTFIT